MSVLDANNPAPRGIIAWMSQNKIAPHILMLLFVIGGFISAIQLDQQVEPKLNSNYVTVQVAYPGASPSEVEDGIILALEDGLQDIQGVASVQSTAYEQFAYVMVQIAPRADAIKVFQDIKNAIDRIVTFSQEAERPVVELQQYGGDAALMTLAVSGNQPLRAIHSLTERLQDELRVVPDVGGVVVTSPATYELSIEVPILKLRELNLTLDGIASIVRESSENLPAGEIHAQEGRILLQSVGKRDTEDKLADIPIATTPEGLLVRLGDIATIRDDFVENDIFVKYNDKPATTLDIYQRAGSTPRRVSENVREYVKKINSELPKGTKVDIVSDTSTKLVSRIKSLRLHTVIGFVLLTCILGIIFEVRVALWITMSIPAVMFGSFLLINLTDTTLNVISLFAFLTAIGIVIDNGIVVGESIYSKREDAEDYISASIDGARSVTLPVFLSVLVNCLMFIPLLYFSGETGKYFSEIPLIAICIFIISLVHALLILPSQLAVAPQPHRWLDYLNRPKVYFHQFSSGILAKRFIPLVHVVLAKRYVVIGLGALILSIFGVLFSFDYLLYHPFPPSEPESIYVSADLPQSALDTDVARVADELSKSIDTFVKGEGSGIIHGVTRTTGSPSGLSGGSTSAGMQSTGAGAVQFLLTLVPLEQRTMTYGMLYSKLYSALPVPRGVTSLNINSFQTNSAVMPIQIGLSHRSSKVLESAARDVTKILASYYGVGGINNGLVVGKRQFDFEILPAARSLGITSSELGRQLRAAFFGTEALRIQRGRNKLQVIVRLPRGERRSLNTLNNLIIRTPAGGEMFLSQAAKITESTSPSIIQRIDGKRQLAIQAEFADPGTSLKSILSNIETTDLPKVLDKYPGLEINLGNQYVYTDSNSKNLFVSVLLVALMIYTILAILLKSYLEPFVILAVLPFVFLGPISAHIILGYDFSIISLVGVIALIGVIINASVMMMFTANGLRSKGYTPLAAIRIALIHRFRAVTVTSMCVFVAVLPFLGHLSPGENAYAPLAVSLGVGALFSIMVTLIILPACYLIKEDFVRRFASKFTA